MDTHRSCTLQLVCIDLLCVCVCVLLSCVRCVLRPWHCCSSLSHAPAFAARLRS